MDAITPVAVVGDTGPLLCAGGLGRRDGIHMLYRRFHGRIVMPAAVRAELESIGAHSDAIGQAARLVIARAPFVNVDQTSFPANERDLTRRSVLDAERARESRGGRAAKTRGHDGEVDAVLLARSLGGILLVNDLPAMQAARGQGVPTATFATVLAAEIADSELDASRAAQMCESLQSTGLFPGLHNPSAARLSGLQIPPGL